MFLRKHMKRSYISINQYQCYSKSNNDCLTLTSEDNFGPYTTAFLEGPLIPLFFFSTYMPSFLRKPDIHIGNSIN